MRVLHHPDRAEWPGLIRRPESDLAAVRETVRDIMLDVRRRGDEALRDLTERFDHVRPGRLGVSRDAIDRAADRVDPELKQAISTAAGNIRAFHERQLREEEVVETSEDIRCWRRDVPIDRVGLYVPGGSAPLFSSVLMMGIPAAIAGCGQVILCSPPDRKGEVHPAVLYAARECGIEQIFGIGGAQAVAAMAYGTGSIPAVDKIFGPGNAWVTAAKQLAALDGPAIDMPAGPSEVLVMAGSDAPPEFVASDLIAQAEHGPDSQVILLTDDAGLADAVKDALKKQLNDLPRAGIARQALNHSACLVFDDLETAMDFSNMYAPEHLILITPDPETLARRVRNAGSVFLGEWTPESLGDYASGTNHTLPTNGYARAYSGLSVDSFMKRITFQRAGRAGLERLAPAVEIMAAREGLEGHRRSVRIRVEALRKEGAGTAGSSL